MEKTLLKILMKLFQGINKKKIINQKVMISMAKDLGLNVSLADAKKEVIQMDSFQGDQGLTKLFESTIGGNG